MVQGLVAYDLGSSKQRIELGAFLVALVYVHMEMVDQRLRSDEPCNTVRPGLPAFVHVDVRDKEAGDSDAILHGGEVLTELRVHELVLVIVALSNRKRHPTVEKADPMPEECERLGREVEVTERGVIALPGVLDGRR